MKPIAVMLLAISMCVCPSVNGQDAWPQWRGPSLDNISQCRGLPVEFGKDKNLLWRVEMPGPARSSPVVWGQRVFVTSVVESDEGLELICLDRAGQVQWRRSLQGRNRQVRMDQANSASASPCTDGQHVWATTAAGYLECFDMDGNPVWSIDLQERYGQFQIQFGMSSTPVLDEDRLYLQLIHGAMRDRSTTSEGTVVCLDALTGEEIWSHKRKTDGYAENKHSYASPTLVRDGNLQYLVSHGADFVIGHSLQDGSELWRCGGLNPQGSDYNPFLRFVASPVHANGKLVVPSAKNGPVLCLRTDLQGDVTADAEARYWMIRQGTPDVATPLIHNGLVFLARETGVMLCVDASTGETVYEKRMFAGKHRSTPVLADGRIYIVGRDGTVVVLSADGEGTVLAENELQEEAKSSPAVVDGRLYIRTNEALYCFSTEG
jgi:outer membrane protein assembly factor BamB